MGERLGGSWTPLPGCFRREHEGLGRRKLSGVFLWVNISMGSGIGLLGIHMILVIVPARGGSKGLPGKNLATVGGIPLVGRAVRTGLDALTLLGEEGRVICSTDDEKIATVAREWGAEVPFIRPGEMASDGAPTIAVVLHCLRELGYQSGTVVLLQPTSPLTAAADVAASVLLHRGSGRSVVSVTPLEHPIEWIWTMDEDGGLNPASAAQRPTRRQDSPPVLRPNGAVYVASAADLLDGGSFLEPPVEGYLMPQERSIDIDSACDLNAVRGVHAAFRPEPVSIGGRLVGPGQSCYIIAEAGVNHDGDLGTALRLVDAAAEAGVDAVKFQTFSADRLATRGAPKAHYQLTTTDPTESQHSMLKRLELDYEALVSVSERCRERGVTFLSTPFDEESADLLEPFGIPAFKISSGDLTNLPFLAHVAEKGLPMVVSTGMGTLAEVMAATDTVRKAGNRDLILLHCVSNYPAPPGAVNLRAMRTISEATGCPVGYSDHTEGIDIAIAAVARGASVVEKHFTLDRGRSGPDHQASIEPGELKRMVRAIRSVEKSLGDGSKKPSEDEKATAHAARKSLVALRTILKGEILDRSSVGARRPGSGISPAHLKFVIGCRARCKIPGGEILQPEMIE